VRLILGLLLFSSACSERKVESNQDTNAVSQSVVAAKQAPLGNYLGRFTTDHGEKGVYLKLNDSSSALYDGLRWIRICGPVENDTLVSFATARMFNRVFTFRGTPQAGEIRGQLTGFSDTLDLVFRPFDESRASTAQSRDKSGFYSNLNYIKEAGDNVGEELLLGAIAGQPTVAFMMAEGSAGFPRIGFNIRESHDTLRFDVSRDTTAPRISAVFGDSAVAVSLSDGERSRLPKVFSLAAFYDQPPEGVCPP
jgi:hypothetical protein